MACCDPRGCDQVFGSWFARRTAARYRKRGLDATGRRIVEILERDGVRGATVLEIGGGVGELQVELLRRGAQHATNLELSPAYEEQARELLAAAGLTGRADRRIVDIAVTPDAVAPADIVVLNRVVCCYPDYRRLLGTAANHARHRLVFTHPPRNVLTRALIGAQNLAFRLRGKQFRVFTHPPRAMLDVLAEHGLRPEQTRRRPVWQVATAARPG